MEKPFKDETKIDKLVHLTNLLFPPISIFIFSSSFICSPSYSLFASLLCASVPFLPLSLSHCLTSKFIISGYCTVHQSAFDKWGLHVLND